MKAFLKRLLPRSVVNRIQSHREMAAWKSRDFSGKSPQFVKEKVLTRYGLPGANWIETGTYVGATTEYLCERFPHVYTIEPAVELYKMACKRFHGKNVTLFNDVSERVFPALLPTLSGGFNFWLDGHYSAGVTFKGAKDCPVEDELSVIKENFDRFTKLVILIDDVRCFLPGDLKYKEYPSVDYLVDWARQMKMLWRIEHDIFIMQKV